MKRFVTLSIYSALAFYSAATYANDRFYFTANHANYDIVYHRISITVNPAGSAAITNGSVTTYFKTTTSNVTSLEFDLDGAMSVSSATYHGSTITKNHNTITDVLTLTIPNIAVTGTLDSVTVNYSGTPILAPASGVPSGYNYKNHGASLKEIYTLGEPYTGHNWWPCKETLYDKIDSVDLIVTAPNTYKVAGNGLVTEVASGGNTITTWKTRYPIATYGVNFAVANYVNYQYSINTSSVNLPVMNYLFSENNNATYKAAADLAQTILPMFVSKLGAYPFLNEKYGLAECTAGWGALEVQSMTFIASDAYDKYTIAHELAHQWFGDKLTTNTWHQIWLNEGFATYCENVIFPENLYPAELAAKRSALKSSVTNSSTTYVSDTTTPNNIFIGSTTQPYPKGGMILSMLRAWLGDTKFFSALNNYLASPGLAYRFTSVDSLQKHMEATTAGLNLTNFFNDWVYKQGRATYAVKYQYVTNGVYIQLTQSPTTAGQGYFDMPVPIQIKNASGLDTTVVIIDKRGILSNSVTGKTYSTNVIYYKLSATPTIAPVFDPNSLVLATASSTTSSGTLNSLIILPFKEIKLAAVSKENHVKLNWSIKTDESLLSIIVEKSTNGSDFKPANILLPLQTGTNLYEGRYTDESTNETQYYRLKIIKKDESFVYSNIERVDGKQLTELQIFPNPVINELTILVPEGFNDNHLKLLIINSNGRTIKKISPGTVNSTKILAPVSDLGAGIYNITLVNGANKKLYSKFMKL